MTILEWNQKQIDEALSDTNRYFFWLHTGRESENDDELVLYYATYGAPIFEMLHREELHINKK